MGPPNPEYCFLRQVFQKLPLEFREVRFFKMLEQPPFVELGAKLLLLCIAEMPCGADFLKNLQRMDIQVVAAGEYTLDLIPRGLLNRPT